MIHRTEHNGDYTRIDNAVLRDKSISEGARSLLVYMLSMSDDWSFSINSLTSYFGLSKTTIVARIGELKRAGYLRTTQLKDHRGKFTTKTWDVFENPNAVVQKLPCTEKTEHGKSGTRKNGNTVKMGIPKSEPIRTINIKNNQSNKNNQGCKKDTAEKCQLGRYENVFLTNAEQEELCNRYSLETLVEYIDRLSGYIHDHPGKKYKNHKATIEKWINEDEGREAT